LIIGKLFRHSGLVILVLGIALLSLALSGANCLGQADSSAVQAGEDLKCVTCETAGVTLVWAVDRDELIGQLKVSGPGWVAVGFAVDEASPSGKLIIGSVVGGQPVVRLRKFSGLTVSPDEGRLVESHAARDQGGTVVIFRAKLRDLGLADRVGKRLSVLLARDPARDDINQFQGGTIRMVSITL
jgi:hypothetical protein